MADSFLTQCRENYLDGITPSNKNSYDREGYKKIVFFAKEYFKDNRYEEFAGSFVEGQYLTPLWAAHMIVEYSNANKHLLIAAMTIIKEFSENSLAPTVAEEEKQWLKINGGKYKEYL